MGILSLHHLLSHEDPLRPWCGDHVTDAWVFIIRPVKISGIGDMAAHPNARGFDSDVSHLCNSPARRLPFQLKEPLSLNIRRKS
jgi:hypothetical protein